MFAISGSNFRVLDTFTGDDSTTTFTTSSRQDFNIDSTNAELFVTIDGVPKTELSDYTVTFTSPEADGSTTIIGNTAVVTFTTAPTSGQFIQIAGFQSSSTSRSVAQIRSEDMTFDGSTTNFALTFPPGSVTPMHGLTIVEIDGKVLRGPDTTYYSGDGSTYTYGVGGTLSDGSTVDPAKTITNSNQIEVHYNGRKLSEGALPNGNYTVDLAAQTVSTNAPANPGDIVAITTLVDKHYQIDNQPSSPVLVLDITQMATDGFSTPGNMRVTTFNNALGMKYRREVLEGRPSGIFFLHEEPLNSAYMYVWLNGTQLVQNSDFTLDGAKITVSGKTITSSDRLDVMYFAIDTATGSIGYRIFKDMLNRTFYRRI